MTKGDTRRGVNFPCFQSSLSLHQHQIRYRHELRGSGEDVNYRHGSSSLRTGMYFSVKELVNRVVHPKSHQLIFFFRLVSFWVLRTVIPFFHPGRTSVLRMMFTMSRPSALTCVIIAGSLSLFLVVFTFFQESLEVPWTYVHNKAEEYINTNTNTTAITTPTSSLYVLPSGHWRITLFYHPAEDELGIVSWLTLTIILNFITDQHSKRKPIFPY